MQLYYKNVRVRLEASRDQAENGTKLPPCIVGHILGVWLTYIQHYNHSN